METMHTLDLLVAVSPCQLEIWHLMGLQHKSKVSIPTTVLTLLALYRNEANLCAAGYRSQPLVDVSFFEQSPDDATLPALQALPLLLQIFWADGYAEHVLGGRLQSGIDSHMIDSVVSLV